MNSLFIFVTLTQVVLLSGNSLLIQKSQQKVIKCYSGQAGSFNRLFKRSIVSTGSRYKKNEQKIWKSPDLTYTLLGLVGYRNQITYSATLSIVRAAFSDWQMHSPYNFKDITPAENADIKVIFTRDYDPKKQEPLRLNERKHNCVSKLGNNPAHAFFANHFNSSGEIHVNNEYIWMESTYIKGSVSLKTLLLHEIGHVLGLTHSTNKNSIMYPFIYTNKIKSIDIQDDLNIHLLYRKLCNIDN